MPDSSQIPTGESFGRCWNKVNFQSQQIVKIVMIPHSFRNIGGLSLTDKAGVRQLESIWGRTFPDKELQLQDIKDIQVKTTSWREKQICLVFFRR